MKEAIFYSPLKSIIDQNFSQIFEKDLRTFVKKTFTPDVFKRKPEWTDKDREFFWKGVKDLSRLLTEDRGHSSSGKLPDYLRSPPARSAYFLYFVPFQAAKFYSLFTTYQKWMREALGGHPAGEPIRIVDLGAGPGTATLTFLCACIAIPEAKGRIFKIELQDQNPKITREGRAFFSELIAAGRFPFTVEISSGALDLRTDTKTPPFLILCGSFLNELNLKFKSSSGVKNKNLEEEQEFEEDPDETPFENEDEVQNMRLMDRKIDSSPSTRFQLTLENFLLSSKGMGTLILEPASPHSSRLLSQLRDSLLKSSPFQIIGPCLHERACPLKDGRDYCHVSVVSEPPTKLYFEYAKRIGGKDRKFLKWSYLWFTPDRKPIERSNEYGYRRVVSDPIKDLKTGKSVLLLCEPLEVDRIPVKGGVEYYRGELLRG